MNRIRAAVIVAVCCAGAGVVLLSVTPPEPVLRKLVTSASSQLLSPHASKLLGTYIEFALAGKMAKTVAAHGDRDDVARIDFALRRAQVRVLNAIEVPHDPHVWPVLIAGFGWCDQVNSVAAQVLAHSFRHAQLYSLWDPETHASPHTVGRVWSDQRHEWLYFDAFFNRPVVYHRTGRGKFEILNKANVVYPDRDPLPAQPIYALDGWVANEYPAGYPRYLLQKFMARMRGEGPAEGPAGKSPEPVAPPAVPQEASLSSAQVPAAPPHDPAVFARVARLYVDARAEDILGDREKAKAKYLAVARNPEAQRDDGARLLTQAARVFARH